MNVLDSKKSRLFVISIIIILVSAVIGNYYFIEKTVDNDDEDGEEETYTEFKIFDETGVGYDYPTDLRVSETGKVTVVVNNQERALEEYTLVIGLGESYEEMDIIEEITDDFNFTLPSNNTAVETTIELAHDEEWNRTVEFSIEEPREKHKLNFLLIRDEEIYRYLHLYVGVTEE